MADERRIRAFLTTLGAEAGVPCRLHLTGGATAVLLGWRASTVEVDIRFVPEIDTLYRALPELKERLEINVEIASPPDFIPELPGWRDRSLFIAREGKLSTYHSDLHSQALAKIERSHTQDLADVREMLRRRLIEAGQLVELFAAIEPQLYRYPAIDPPSFRRAVEEVVEWSREQARDISVQAVHAWNRRQTGKGTILDRRMRSPRFSSGILSTTLVAAISSSAGSAEKSSRVL